jgi:probable phosphomutase (TIGR03848 family)
MATLILARHGRTSANVSGVLAGRTRGVHLDDTGKQQAQAAGQRLSSLPLAAVVTSPLERCRETSKAILAAQEGQPAVSTERARQTDKNLTECDYGEWQGRALKTLAKEPLWKTVQAHPSAVQFPGGEAMTAMSSRAVGAVRRWDEKVEAEHGPHAVWVAVSHGDVIKAVLADALGLHLDAFQRIVVDPASLSVIRYTPGRPFVVTMNTTAGDLSHLRPPAKKRRRRTVSSDAPVGGGAGPGAGAGGAL